MNSGIYALNFSNGCFYIGKSVNFTRRWKEHFTKFEKGTAAKNLQQCFNECGYPETEVLLEVHPEHLDVLEPILIYNNWRTGILNTTRDTVAEDMRNEHIPMVKESLGTLCDRILSQEKEISKLEHKLRDQDQNHRIRITRIKNGQAVLAAEQQAENFRQIALDRDKEINRLKSRNIFQRLFDL